MKRFLWNLLVSLWGGKKLVGISNKSQVHILQDRMRKAGLSHGAETIVNLQGVYVKKSFFGPRIYFCPMEKVRVVENISVSDGRAIPENVNLQNVKVERALVGTNVLYDLENVQLCSNGKIQITGTKNTKWKLHHSTGVNLLR